MTDLLCTGELARGAEAHDRAVRASEMRGDLVDAENGGQSAHNNPSFMFSLNLRSPCHRQQMSSGLALTWRLQAALPVSFRVFRDARRRALSTEAMMSESAGQVPTPRNR